MGQFNQDFHGKFPPLHRPLSLRDESQPARGLWLFEQVSVVLTDQYVSLRHLIRQESAHAARELGLLGAGRASGGRTTPGLLYVSSSQVEA